MKLDDLSARNPQIKALKENFEIDFDPSNLTNVQARTMLKKVKGLISESKRTPKYHTNQRNASYLKMLFMEQALSKHIASIRGPRIVLENEEVEKSQVILAAQDINDTIQKMYEDVNDMLVKELPALVDSIQSEIGANESDEYSSRATETLNTLNAALQEAQSSLKDALGVLTGQAPMDNFGGDEAGEFAGDEDMDMDMELGADETDDEMPDELPPLPDMDEMPTANAGREKR